MDEIYTPNNREIAMLTSLAQEAQYYAKNVIESMVQLGRVLTDAKPLVRHGEWENWVAENTGFSVRRAQVFMQIYARFGGNSDIAQIKERSKIFKLLSLPAGTEDAFFAENNVDAMSTREVEDAVRQVREEMGLQIAKEKKARKAAEDRAAELELKADKIPDQALDDLVEKTNTIEQQRREILRLTEDGNKALRIAQSLERERDGLKREIAEQNDLIDQVQAQHDRMRNELLTMKSAAAKGDAERVPTGELTIDVFSSAVRQFIGACARMPQMGGTFAMMMLQERNAYDELLRTVESWASGSRRALDTIDGEVQIHG